MLAAFFGKEALGWLVNAGGLGIVISWSLVSLSFYRLRRKEPTMVRPFKVAMGQWVGLMAFILSLGLVYLYLPGSTSALNAIEWFIVVAWSLVGIGFYTWTSRSYGRKSMKMSMQHYLSD